MSWFAPTASDDAHAHSQSQHLRLCNPKHGKHTCVRRQRPLTSGVNWFLSGDKIQISSRGQGCLKFPFDARHPTTKDFEITHLCIFFLSASLGPLLPLLSVRLCPCAYVTPSSSCGDHVLIYEEEMWLLTELHGGCTERSAAPNWPGNSIKAGLFCIIIKWLKGWDGAEGIRSAARSWMRTPKLYIQLNLSAVLMTDFSII